MSELDQMMRRKKREEEERMTKVESEWSSYAAEVYIDVSKCWLLGTEVR